MYVQRFIEFLFLRVWVLFQLDTKFLSGELNKRNEQNFGQGP